MSVNRENVNEHRNYSNTLIIVVNLFEECGKLSHILNLLSSVASQKINLVISKPIHHYLPIFPQNESLIQLFKGALLNIIYTSNVFLAPPWTKKNHKKPV